MTTVDATVPANLRSAALYIQRHGWLQGHLVDVPSLDTPFPAACAAGAIRMAITGTALSIVAGDDVPLRQMTSEEIRQVCATLDAVALWVNPTEYLNFCEGETSVDSEQLVGGWNDRWVMTAEKVTKVLRAIADQYEASHASTT
jgi:hypothetical protein